MTQNPSPGTIEKTSWLEQSSSFSYHEEKSGKTVELTNFDVRELGGIAMRGYVLQKDLNDCIVDRLLAVLCAMNIKDPYWGVLPKDRQIQFELMPCFLEDGESLDNEDAEPLPAVLIVKRDQEVIARFNPVRRNQESID
ncbi:MAG: hypothetical protein Q7K57_44210 [Burkholderiaceae bacterium]|nr:hypothetical protein [Burkholderiaceae bacterium]